MQQATFPDLPDRSSSCCSLVGGPCHPLEGGTGVPSADSEEEVAGSWQDYSEVHLLLRMPRPNSHPPALSASSKYGGVAEMEELVERLQAALEVKEAQRKAAVDALARRVRAIDLGNRGGPSAAVQPLFLPVWYCATGRSRLQLPSAPCVHALLPLLQSSEAENLQRVVRELTESRAKAVSQRATLQAQYGELQSEYARMLRIADLSRTVRWAEQACVGGGTPAGMHCRTAPSKLCGYGLVGVKLLLG
jgi:hypothetical protein